LVCISGFKWGSYACGYPLPIHISRQILWAYAAARETPPADAGSYAAARMHACASDAGLPKRGLIILVVNNVVSRQPISQLAVAAPRRFNPHV